jgi:hypothetical protein
MKTEIGNDLILAEQIAAIRCWPSTIQAGRLARAWAARFRPSRSDATMVAVGFNPRTSVPRHPSVA